MSTSNLDLPLLTESQAGKYITVNTALTLLDKWQGGVASRSNSGPPGSPSEGDAYIVDATTGDWSSFTLGDLAVYYQDSAGDAAWVAATPAEGPQVYVADENIYVQWSGSAWVGLSSVSKVVAVTGSKTLALSDTNSIQRVTAAATITVPVNSDVQFAIGTAITFFRETASAVTVQGASPSPTLHGSQALASQYDSFTLVKLDEDVWATL